jgi:hypothetical protein
MEKRLMDTSAPLEQNEIPRVQKNKQLREAVMTATASDRKAEDSPSEQVGHVQERGKGHRMRSSISRGEESSGFEMTGIISEFASLSI